MALKIYTNIVVSKQKDGKANTSNHLISSHQEPDLLHRDDPKTSKNTWLVAREVLTKEQYDEFQWCMWNKRV